MPGAWRSCAIVDPSSFLDLPPPNLQPRYSFNLETTMHQNKPQAPQIPFDFRSIYFAAENFAEYVGGTGRSNMLNPCSC